LGDEDGWSTRAEASGLPQGERASRCSADQAPSLILHSEEDPQVPPQESQEFAAALKKAGKTFTYITYPNEGHGLQQRDHRQDANERELAFLNKYLKPALPQQ
jgi:dipeptidyl aminopeptidase/acylaminoacyl peptidase